MTPEWYEAVSARDAAAARALAHADVRMGGPRGDMRGHEVLTRWIETSGIRLRPVVRHDLAEGVTVMEEEATWDAGGPPVRVWTLYAVRGGLLTAILRHDSLGAARETAAAL